MNEAGRQTREHYADTGGFTDMVFAATSLLGYRFVPRIRDLPLKRLHVFEPKSVPIGLKGLIGNRIREDTIPGTGPMSCAAWPRWRPGRCRRASSCGSSRRIRANTILLSPFVKSDGLNGRSSSSTGCWTSTCSTGPMAGLNKGEAHHALKNALRIGRQGEIRDRTTEGQHFRIAGLNLLASIIIYWNTDSSGASSRSESAQASGHRRPCSGTSRRLGWGHILLTGEYRWPRVTTSRA